jgi:stage IV sporulation protein FB
MKLDFRIGSIPVSVHGSFLLMTAFLGFSAGSLRGIVQWIVVVFVGVLLHELGHALVGRSFGLAPRIDLLGFGGLTSWTGGRSRLPAAKGIAISLAGPFTGLAIGLGTILLVRMRAGLPPLGIFNPEVTWSDMQGDPLSFLDQDEWGSLVKNIVWVNGGWGVLNLLPILPMDGGNVLLQALGWGMKGNAERPARIVSCALAALLALGALRIDWRFAALLAAIFALQNFQALRGAAVPPSVQWPPKF